MLSSNGFMVHQRLSKWLCHHKVTEQDYPSWPYSSGYSMLMGQPAHLPFNFFYFIIEPYFYTICIYFSEKKVKQYINSFTHYLQIDILLNLMQHSRRDTCIIKL